LPCWPLRSCPFSIVDESVRAGKPKFRLTTDLSWPHVGALRSWLGAVDAVNTAMDRSGWPQNRMMRVSEFGEAAALLRGPRDRPRRSRVWSLDCKAYYRAFGRQRRELWRNAIFLPDGVQLDERCCFGDASAATKCSRASNYVVFCVRRAIAAFDAAHPTVDPEWVAFQAQRRAGCAAVADGMPPQDSLSWVGMFVDDLMGSSADDLLFSASGEPVLRADGEQMRRAEAHFVAARAELERLGWASEASKEQGPRERLDALGADLDLASWRLRLTAAKRARYAAHAREVAACGRCERRGYMRLLGRLTSALQCYPIGRQRLHAAWRAARVSSRLGDGGVPVSAAVQRDLRWWADELWAEDEAARARHEGVPLAETTGGEPGFIYADASGEEGWMAWAVVGDELLYADGVWSDAERELLIICEKELLASTWGLVAFQPELPRAVVSYTDNTVAMAAMQRMAPGSELMQELTARRTAFVFGAGVVESARRITSKANLWADLGSRLQTAEVLRQAANFGLAARRVAVPPAWLDTAELCALARER
jgi:hypothetical protein